MPNAWLPAILNAVLPRIDPSRFQRFMDLVMMRARAVSDLASDPEAFQMSVARRSKTGRMSCRKFCDNEVRLHLHALAYNLATLPHAASNCPRPWPTGH